MPTRTPEPDQLPSYWDTIFEPNAIGRATDNAARPPPPPYSPFAPHPPASDVLERPNAHVVPVLSRARMRALSPFFRCSRASPATNLNTQQFSTVGYPFPIMPGRVRRGHSNIATAGAGSNVATSGTAPTQQKPQTHRARRVAFWFMLLVICAAVTLVIAFTLTKESEVAESDRATGMVKCRGSVPEGLTCGIGEQKERVVKMEVGSDGEEGGKGKWALWATEGDEVRECKKVDVVYEDEMSTGSWKCRPQV